MASVPPPRSFGQPAPSSYGHSSAGSSSQQRSAGRRSSKVAAVSGRRDIEPQSPTSKANDPGSPSQQRRNRALKNANQRMRNPGKLGNSSSTPALAGAQIVAGDAGKPLAGKPSKQDALPASNDNVAMLQQHLLDPEAASGEVKPGLSEGVAVPPLPLARGAAKSNWDEGTHFARKGETPNFGEARDASNWDAYARFANKDETANFGRANERSSGHVEQIQKRSPTDSSGHGEQIPKRSPATSAWTGSLNSSSSAPALPQAQIAPDAEQSRPSGNSSMPKADTSDTRVAAMEMELRLLQNRLAAETRAHKQLAESVADDSEKRRILELQLNECRVENRQLQRMVAEAEERARYSQEVTEDLQQRLHQVEATQEYRVKRERSRAIVIARLEGILPKSTLLKALT